MPSILPLYHGGNDRDGRQGIWKRVRRRLLELRLDVITSRPSTLLPLLLSIICCVVFVVCTLIWMLSGPAASVPTPASILSPPSPASVLPSTTPAPKSSTGSGAEATVDASRLVESDEAASDKARQKAVVAAFTHAWEGYRRHAFGHDEIRPTTNATNDSWGGFGAVLIDGLDTMMLMGLDEYVAEARKVVQADDFAKDYSASFFETTIRYLGGLLAAYAASDDELYLTKAVQLGDALLPAFNSKTGLPYHEVNLQTGAAKNPSWNTDNCILSEIGSVQLEFKSLSHFTGDPKYAAAADSVMDVLWEKREQSVDGLYPVYISAETGEFRDAHVTMGALADSFYEYLLKQWLLTSKTEPKYRRMYDETVAGIRQHLVARSTKSGLTYVAERMGNRLVHKMDHLACFLGGMFALGAESHQLDDEVFSLGAAITETCHQLYARSPSGIAPEFVNFNAGGDDFVAGAPYYLLRPETVESMFIMWRLTHDQQYRDMGWAVFLALEKMCKVPSGGYSGLKSTLTTARTWDDAQPSYFLAETLKYLYLLFTDDSVIPLNEWVFNTEAHPLRVWDPTTA